MNESKLTCSDCPCKHFDICSAAVAKNGKEEYEAFLAEVREKRKIKESKGKK